MQSASSAFDAFVARIANPAFWAFLKGALAAGIGGGVLAEAVAFAAWLGVSVLTAKLIGIGLILYGLSIVLPLVWERAMARLGIVGDVA